MHFRLLLFILLLSSTAHAQSICNYSFSGKVTSEGRPLPGVVIQITPQIGTITDPEGNFKIEHICPNRYVVRVLLVGYETLTKLIEINANTYHEFELVEHIINLDEVIVKEQKQNIEGAQNFVTLGG